MARRYNKMEAVIRDRKIPADDRSGDEFEDDLTAPVMRGSDAADHPRDDPSDAPAEVPDQSVDAGLAEDEPLESESARRDHRKGEFTSPVSPESPQPEAADHVVEDAPEKPVNDASPEDPVDDDRPEDRVDDDSPAGSLDDDQHGDSIEDEPSDDPAAVPEPLMSATPVEDRPLEPGFVLRDRFEIVSLVHTGGMSHVYKAVDRRRLSSGSEQSHVAIKMLRLSALPERDVAAALEREAAQTQHLSHPNIVNIFDFDMHDGQFYLVMEWLQGESLKELLQRTSGQQLAPEFAWQIIHGIASALEHAHSNNIVHADINLSNIFITDTKQIKLLDFGVSRCGIDEEDAGSDEQIWVTHKYASPEVLLGSVPVFTDDIFALGCVAYRLLSGRHPFACSSSLRAKLSGLTALPLPGLSAQQWRTLERALQFKRSDRPTTAAAFLDQQPARTGEILHRARDDMRVPDRKHRARNNLRIRDRLRRIRNSMRIRERMHSIRDSMRIRGRLRSVQDSMRRFRVRVRDRMHSVRVRIRESMRRIRSNMRIRDRMHRVWVHIRDKMQGIRAVPREAWLVAMSVVAVAVAVAAGLWFLLRTGPTDEPVITAQPPAAIAEPAVTEAAPAAAELDERLQRAAQAMSAERYVLPEDDNARLLYNQVLAVDPDNTAAAAGLRSISDYYVQQAGMALSAGNLTEATAALAIAADTDPGNPATAIVSELLAARVDEQLASARPAAADEDLAQTAAMLSDGELDPPGDAPEGAGVGEPVRASSEEQQLIDALARAEEHMAARRLTLPADRNAYALLLELQEQHGNDDRLRASIDRLGEKLLAEALAASTARDDAGARRLLGAAESLGLDPDEIESTRQILAANAEPAPDAQPAVAAAPVTPADQQATSTVVETEAALAATEESAIPGAAGDSDAPATDVPAPEQQAASTAAETETALAAAEESAIPGAAEDSEAPATDVPPPEQQAAPTTAETETALAAAEDSPMSETAAVSDAPATDGPQQPRYVSLSDLQIEKYVAPVYPLNARRRGLTGNVEINFRILADGSTDDIEIVSSQPGDVFVASARKAVSKWRFAPPGEILSAQVTVRFDEE